MPEYLHPGVYVEETSFRGKPIEGVATSTAGFVGAARKGPEGKPTLVTSYGEFVRRFGAPISPPARPGDHLGHAVRSFFQNGGKRVYVVRVLGKGALKSRTAVSPPAADGLTHGTVLRLPPNTTVRGPTTVLPLDTLRLVQAGASIKIFTRPGPSAAFALKDTVQVAAANPYDRARGNVNLAGAGIGPGVTLTSENTYFLVAGKFPDAAASAARTATFEALYKGTGGDDVSVRIRPADSPPVKLTTRRFVRAKPSLATTTAGVGNGAVTVPVSAAALALVRQGDTVRLADVAGTVGEDDRAVGALPAVDVSFTGTAGGNAVVYPAGTTITLTTRDGNATSLLLLTTTAGIDLTGALAANAHQAFPHAVAALVKAGDVLVISQAANTLTITVGAVNWPAAPQLPLTAGGTKAYAAPAPVALTLGVSPGRLFALDLSGLAAPARAGAQEPLAVGNGAAVVGAAALLVDPGRNMVVLAAALPAGVTDADWTTFESLQATAAGQKSVPVATTAPFYTGAVVELDDGRNVQYGVVDDVDPAAGTVTLQGNLGNFGAAQFLDVDPDPSKRRAGLRVLEMDVLVYEGGEPKETFSGLSWNNDPLTAAYRKYYVTRLNDPTFGSRLVRVQKPANEGTTPDDAPTPRTGFPVALAGGSDGAAITDVDLIGADNGPGSRTGIEALRERDDVALVAVPGVTLPSVQGALVTHCELLRYRFALLDGLADTADVAELQAHRNNVVSSYAGYYAPWLESVDLETGNTVYLPPSGAVAGICARTDSERGVHKAPANEVVRDITGLRFPFGNGEQDVLNPARVNLLREFEGRGRLVWGARTTSSDTEWMYVNVRRLFIFLEHSIDRGTQWVVFEPNNEALWARVRETVEAFLVGVWKTGALMGTKPEEAFFVRVDRSTMSQDDIDNGRLIVLVGVAPTKPAEFVIFRIGQFTATTAS